MGDAIAGSSPTKLEIDPEKVMICNCTDCQRLSGSSFRTVAFTVENGFKLMSGELKVYLKTGDSGNKRQQAFCPECGSSIYATSEEGGPLYGIRTRLDQTTRPA